MQDRYRAAATHYRRALDIAQRTDNRAGRLEVLHALGRLHHTTGDSEAALDYHRQALEVAVRLQHRADQARVHDGIAYAYVALDQPDHACQHWQAALDILTSLGTEYTPDQDTTATTIRTHLARIAPATSKAAGHDLHTRL